MLIAGKTIAKAIGRLQNHVCQVIGAGLHRIALINSAMA